MSDNVVNLNRFRKKKLKQEEAKRAEMNRIRHGRTTAQREREASDRERATRFLDGKRLEQESGEGSARVPPLRDPEATMADLGTMKLDKKGRFAPPPRLPDLAQVVSESLSAWPDVHARTHWFLGDEEVVDGADFYLHDDELGHLHLDGDAHVAVTKKIRDALIAAELALPFEWSRSFVVRPIQKRSDVPAAEFLFRLAYDRLAGTRESELLERIEHERRSFETVR